MSRVRMRPAKRRIAIALAVACTCAAAPALAIDEKRDDVAAFITDMQARHGFDAATLGQLFARVESRPAIVEAISRPAEKTMSWPEYRARFITERRIARGRDVARDQGAALDKASSASGVPGAILLAIVGVETFYGEITGRHRVIDALSTLAFDYPPRSGFFRGELEQFLLMAREESLDPLVPLGSYAGAMGIPQFMPTSFRAFAVDGGGDGHRDLWSDWSDVFASVGNYLKVHGWRPGEPVVATACVDGADLSGLETAKLDLSTTVGELRKRGVRFDTGLPDDTPAVLVELRGENAPQYRVGFANFYAITRYNRSAMYASAVADLAEAVQRPAAPPGEPAESPGPAAPSEPVAPAESAAPAAPNETPSPAPAPTPTPEAAPDAAPDTAPEAAPGGESESEPTPDPKRPTPPQRTSAVPASP